MDELSSMMDDWLAPAAEPTKSGAISSPAVATRFPPSVSIADPTPRDQPPPPQHKQQQPPAAAAASAANKLAELSAVLDDLDDFERGALRRSSSVPAKKSIIRRRSSSFSDHPESEQVADPEQEAFLRTWGRQPAPLAVSVPLPSSSSPALVGASAASKVRCKPACVGGSDAKPGWTSSPDQLVPCANLRCTKCDMSVMAFPDSVWAASTDYLFLRNSFPNAAALRQRLTRKPGFCARCCQCSFMSSRNVEPVNTESFRWVCGGHAKQSSSDEHSLLREQQQLL